MGHRNRCSMTWTVLFILHILTSTHPAIPWQVVPGADSLSLLKKSVTSMVPEFSDLTVSCQLSESLVDINHLY